ncbi:hypothetical protein [Rathayibacter sp. AY1A7]|uniref:hypothetical protein n=1 Tax=Rathayibacter sp. AY1A7 TaxID=2080524 RepID=UPI0011AFD698|nr:hypothetical protein [Rathayibacter sp. AY1A7]
MKLRENRAILATAMCIGLLLGAVAVPTAANAAAIGITGDVHTGEYKLYYGTFRYHSAGTSNFRLNSASPGYCGARLGIGMYNGSGGETNMPTWNSTGYGQSFTWSGGSTLPTGTYAMMAHNRSGGYCYYPNDRIYWGGTLTL